MNIKNNTTLRAADDTELLPFLLTKMGGMTRTGIKQLLGQRRVLVNGTVQTRHDTPLRKGDRVVIVSGRGNAELRHPKLRMVYEDEWLIVVEKKQGLLTVPVYAGGTETTAFSILKAYVKRQDPRNGIYVVHRLDRETSGLLVFAKTPELQAYMRTYWRQIVTRRTYIALAEGLFAQSEGTITTWLTEDKRHAMVYSSPTDNGGQIAVSHYAVVRQTTAAQEAQGGFSLVELNLETGRTNQIRVHLAGLGHPIVGDRKYGTGNTSSPIDRLCLHARVLEFIHPVTEQKVHFQTPTPKDFLRVFHDHKSEGRG